MHSYYGTHGMLFIHNGDYSGAILVNQGAYEVSSSFKELVKAANDGPLQTVWTEAELDGIRDFIGYALIREAISRLEQLDHHEALTEPYTISILQDMIYHERD